MRAFVYEKYGPPEVLQLREVEKPAPKDDEVLIAIRATTVTAGDFRARTLEMPAGFGLMARLVFGVLRPRQPVLGSELAGVVEAVGKEVKSFAVGDAVFAFGDTGMGCHAEYRCIRENGPLALKPANLSFDEAAALSFGGTTALHFLQKAELQPGERVLINGASGSVGTACVQLAKHFGAEVTGVCSSANVELVRSLGAAHVIDYTQEDFTRNGQTYDVIIDTAGTAAFSRSKSSLAEAGRLLLINGSLADMLRAPLTWMSKKKIVAGVALGTREAMQLLAKLAEEGRFKPVIDRRYRFEELIEAHRYVDTGRKKGNIIITLP